MCDVAVLIELITLSGYLAPRSGGYASIHGRNLLFSMDELLDAIGKLHDSAVGPDDIRYEMIKHLPSGAVQILLDILNDIWSNGNLPASWHQANVVSLL